MPAAAIITAMPLLTVVDHEKFAEAVVRLGTGTAAYREVFDPEHEQANSTAWERASRFLARPDISRRVDELRHEALVHSQISVVNMMHDLHDMATADPRELLRDVVGCCRYCHGVEGKYQWLDDVDYCNKCDEIEDENVARVKLGKRQKKLPDCEGGFGYDARKPPNPMCTSCLGAGVLHVIIADTSTLSAKAAKLYKGIRQKADGSVEVLLHDQVAARDQLHRLMGAYKDSLAIPSLPPVETGKAAGDVHKTYLSLINGGRAA